MQFGKPTMTGRGTRLELRSMARQYIAQEATLLHLVLQYIEAHPGKRLGAADQERSSPAWDAIALAALPTCLSGLFPSSLCSMYAATTTERKLAAGIPARHHWPGGDPRKQRYYYSLKAQTRDSAVEARWAATRAEQQRAHAAEGRAAAQAGGPTQRAAERDVFQEARVRLGRARRLVAAAESALAVLLDQEEAVEYDAEQHAEAQARTARAREALALGRGHVEAMQEAVRRGGQWRGQEDPPSYRTAWARTR